jgi:aryl-alcohol dehydrogenase-like predicted oxidoreductase
MDLRTLPHTSLAVSRVCFGTMTFGAQTDEATSIRMIDFCLDHGINFVDTANVYNKGASEEILGKALKGRRDRVVLASKVRGKMGERPEMNGLSRAAIRRAIDDSLRRLGTDYLDLYYLHLPDYATPIDESLAAMQELVSEGKVRQVANSNYSGWQVTEMLWMAKEKGYQPAVVTQPMYNLLARGIEQEYLPMCQRFGVSTVVYNPLAGGLLTGKQKRDAPIAGTRFDKNQMYLDRYWHGQTFDAVEKLQAIANRAGRTLLSLALNWVYRHTSADCVILGASKMEHLEQNLAALDDGPLIRETLDACDQVWAELRGPTPKYNR